VIGHSNNGRPLHILESTTFCMLYHVVHLLMIKAMLEGENPVEYKMDLFGYNFTTHE
jgi:hypothetical protein